MAKHARITARPYLCSILSRPRGEIDGLAESLGCPLEPDGEGSDVDR